MTRSAARCGRRGKRGVAVVAADTQGEAPFTIRPSVAVLEPDGGRVEMSVSFVGTDGSVLDEIRISHGGAALREDGEALGALVADYLQSRVGKARAPVTDDVPPADKPVAAAAPTPEPTPPAAAPSFESSSAAGPPASRAGARARRAPPAVKHPQSRLDPAARAGRAAGHAHRRRAGLLPASGRDVAHLGRGQPQGGRR